MTTTRTAKPSYRSRTCPTTMPVPLLVIIAPSSGVHPCEERPDVSVAQCKCQARHADSDDKHAEDEKDGSV